ncbi:hypothetical protein AB0E96_29150, partial [Kitasatospora sp. NPDC036755]|uniref:hypothetical protein n=1 Tax=Kitasatospora sp. NPDC036755 TaxID=3154600 RepID=UPI0033FF0BAB
MVSGSAVGAPAGGCSAPVGRAAARRNAPNRAAAPAASGATGFAVRSGAGTVVASVCPRRRCVYRWGYLAVRYMLEQHRS